MSAIEMQQRKDGVYEAHKDLDLKDAMILGVLGNSRTFFQYEDTYKKFQEGRCPFCHLDELRFPVIFRVGKWAVKKNDMPYINCEHHLVLVYEGEHITDWKMLDRESKADFMEAIDKAEEEFSIEGCAVVFRRGDARRHAGTISHIHGHIMVVQLDDEGLPVGELRAYFAKTREELQYCKKMVETFERVRTGDLTEIEKGFLVFKGGRFLNSLHNWQEHSKPQDAELLQLPLEQLKFMCTDMEQVQYYEAMTSKETGILLIDGPHKLNDTE